MLEFLLVVGLVVGLIVDPRNPRELAEALARFADPQTRSTLRERARRSGATLTPEAVAALILDSVARVRMLRSDRTVRARQNHADRAEA
jgi:glycosyltransferase involved in cell wall biosynthesis